MGPYPTPGNTFTATRFAGGGEGHVGEGRPLATTRFATRHAQRLSYEVIGSDDGTPLLALHDLLVDRGQLRPLAEALAEAGYRVVLPDARGHGASPMISGRAYPSTELAADALAVLDAEGISAALVVAVGWGGATALTLAAGAPERVAALALIAPAVPPLLLDHPNPDAQRSGEALREAIADAASAAGKGQTERALDGYLGVQWGSGWREHVSRTRLAAIHRAAASLGPLLVGMAPEGFDRVALQRIAIPVTLLLRDDAPAYERWTAEALSRGIPGSGVQAVSLSSVDAGRGALSAEWAVVLARVLRALRA